MATRDVGWMVYCIAYIQAVLTVFLARRNIICLQQVPFERNEYCIFIKPDFFLYFSLP